MKKIRLCAGLILTFALSAAVTLAEQEGQTGGKCVPLDWPPSERIEGAQKCCVVMTTVFREVSVGDTVTIRILSETGKLSTGEPVSVDEVTPRSTTSTAVIRQARIDDKNVAVTLVSCPARVKTVRLNVQLDGGEEVGIALRLTG